MPELVSEPLRHPGLFALPHVVAAREESRNREQGLRGRTAIGRSGQGAGRRRGLCPRGHAQGVYRGAGRIICRGERRVGEVRELE